jgi:hypothetical protein
MQTNKRVTNNNRGMFIYNHLIFVCESLIMQSSAIEAQVQKSAQNSFFFKKVIF